MIVVDQLQAVWIYVGTLDIISEITKDTEKKGCLEDVAPPTSLQTLYYVYTTSNFIMGILLQFVTF